jgi:hypothetical protein
MKKIFLISVILFSLKGFAQEACDDKKLPIIFVHGFLASGDSWATQIQRFIKSGYCEDRLFVFDWNTIGEEKSDSLLEIFIRKVLIKTKTLSVNLVAHSAGGGLCFPFLKDSLRAKLVSNYVHIGSLPITGAAGPHAEIPTMNIYSPEDKVVKGYAIDGTTNVMEPGFDHLQVASSGLTFESVYSFFNNNQKPVFNNIQENQSLSSISGRVVTLGENLPMSKDTVLLYEFDAQKGERKTNKPTILLTDLNGFWPSTLVSKNSFLEFELHSKKSRVIRYYVEPQQSNNHLMYLRTIPTSGLVSGLMRAVPKNDSTVALAIFSSNHAIIYGRDSLTIDTVNLSTATLSPAKKTIAASFVFDDGDGKTSKTNVKGFGIGMFLSATDYYIKPSDTEKSAIYFNGKRILVPRIPSKDAVMVIMFN